MLGKNTILKAIHNGMVGLADWLGVWMLGKNTILKAIHNASIVIVAGAVGVNAG